MKFFRKLKKTNISIFLSYLNTDSAVIRYLLSRRKEIYSTWEHMCRSWFPQAQEVQAAKVMARCILGRRKSNSAWRFTEEEYSANIKCSIDNRSMLKTAW